MRCIATPDINCWHMMASHSALRVDIGAVDSVLDPESRYVGRLLPEVMLPSTPPYTSIFDLARGVAKLVEADDA